MTLERLRGKDGKFVARGQAGGAAPRAKSPTRRKPNKSGKGWTRDKTAVFFRELAIVCNVSAALRKAGLSNESSRVYDRSKNDASFRAAWDAALFESYRMLELEMLERVRFKDDRPQPKTEVEKRLREIPSALALQLLKLHQARAKPAAAAAAPTRRMDPARGRVLRRELDAMLSEFNRRMGGNG